MAKPIGTLGTIDSITVGSRVLTDITNLKVLYAAIENPNNFSGFIEANSTSVYQVPNGKTLKVVGVRLVTQDQTTSGRLNIFYSDTSVSFNGGSGTNNVYMHGTSDVDNGPLMLSADAGVLGSQSYDIEFNVPQNKYPALSASPASTVRFGATIYAYEV